MRDEIYETPAVVEVGEFAEFTAGLTHGNWADPNPSTGAWIAYAW